MSGFAVRIFKLFIEFRPVKAGKIKLFCLVHDFDADVVGHQLAGEPRHKIGDTVDHARCKRAGKRQDQHGQDDGKTGVQRAACGGNKRVDQVLCNQRRDNRQKAGQNRQGTHDEENPFPRLPHKLKEIQPALEKVADQLGQIGGNLAKMFRRRNPHLFLQFRRRPRRHTHRSHIDTLLLMTFLMVRIIHLKTKKRNLFAG